MDTDFSNLYDVLAAYSESDFYPYHMPGHKRSFDMGVLSDVIRYDITEIDGFDNLHQAEGVIKQAQQRAAVLYGADESFFLVNGSTCGVLASIMSVTDKADTVLVARNCHKSVYNAAILQDLKLRYICPGIIEEYDICDAISAQAVKDALEKYPECKAVVITSPTYEGIISDIKGIAETVHERGKVLVVDEAHGAHFGLADNMPENAARQGADLVINSLHKTLPSMTQTAVLHVNGSYVNRDKLRRYLSIFQTSSPSYVFMAGMDHCISYMKENGLKEFDKLRANHRKFLKKMSKCRYIRVAFSEPRYGGNEKYCFVGSDICKLVISVKGTSLSGRMLYDILRDDFHMQMEMAAATYVLAIMTIADEWQAWERLADALLQIDGRIECVGNCVEGNTGDETVSERAPLNKTENLKVINTHAEAMSISQALSAVYEGADEVSLMQAEGLVSGAFVNLYPPGTPILVPGEIIDAAVIGFIEHSIDLGLNVQGISDKGTICVLPRK